MARPKIPAALAAGMVSGNRTTTGSAHIFKPRSNTSADSHVQIAKPWQIEVYRHLNICGEARYAVNLFASIAGRAEIGISEGQTKVARANWVSGGAEVEALAEIAPTVRDRSRLVRTFMVHWQAVGECYLIARDRTPLDPGYVSPPEGFRTWHDYLNTQVGLMDLMDPDFDMAEGDPNHDNPIWEIVAVTELRKNGETWEVRHVNGNWLTLSANDPVIRMFNPDPADRQEAWSPHRSALPTLREIEYFTRHIFTQVRSRLVSAGIWFMPEGLTYPAPPPSAVAGGQDAIDAMNEAEQFMAYLYSSSTEQLEDDEVAFPTVVMGDAPSLAEINQEKLIKFWSEIDDKVMTLRSDAIRRYALSVDMPPEQVLGSSGLAVTGAGGSAGSVNHWGVWANEEQTISAHVEPALDDFTGVMTTAFLHYAVPNTTKVIGYSTESMRLRQDRSKEALELYDRGLLKGEVVVRENNFDPDTDMMDDEEKKTWMLIQFLKGGSSTPEQMQAAFIGLGGSIDMLPVVAEGTDDTEARGLPGRSEPKSLEAHPYQGPPREQHDHSPAPFSALAASAEGLVLRALEKAGNRVLNNGVRGRDRDRETNPIDAHLTASAAVITRFAPEDFDIRWDSPALMHLDTTEAHVLASSLRDYCSMLYNETRGYTRESLMTHVRGLR